MGLFSKLTGGSSKPPKAGKSKTIRSGEWEIRIEADGTPVHFDRKGKEWLDASKTWASPGRAYFLHDGFDGKGDECLALTTQTEGLRARKLEEGVEAALVTDDGAAYVITDEGTLYTITAEKAGQKSLAEDRPDAYLLTQQLAAVAEDAGESITLKGVELATGKAWRKVIAYEAPEEGAADITIEQAEGGLKLTTPAGTVHLFTAAGSPLA